MWAALSCCDGLCGCPLGSAVKSGSECTVAWLCSAVTFGSQIVAASAERRISNSKGDIVAVDQDFDTRPKGYTSSETDHLMHAKPIPEVIAALKQYLNGDESSSLGVPNGM
jgi:hypothetical protein